MRQEKTLFLNHIKTRLDDSKAIVFTSYKSMNPNKAAHFRMQITQSGGSFEVFKKRMLLKAAEHTGFSLDKAMLNGHIGVVFVQQDPVQTTKALYNFRKENEGLLEVIGGRFEGKLCTAHDVELISKLPSQDEMRAQLLGLFEAPMSQTLAVVEALLCSVVYCLENKSKED